MMSHESSSFNLKEKIRSKTSSLFKSSPYKPPKPGTVSSFLYRQPGTSHLSVKAASANTSPRIPQTPSFQSNSSDYFSVSKRSRTNSLHEFPTRTKTHSQTSSVATTTSATSVFDSAENGLQLGHQIEQELLVDYCTCSKCNKTSTKDPLSPAASVQTQLLPPLPSIDLISLTEENSLDMSLERTKKSSPDDIDNMATSILRVVSVSQTQSQSNKIDWGL